MAAKRIEEHTSKVTRLSSNTNGNEKLVSIASQNPVSGGTRPSFS